MKLTYLLFISLFLYLSGMTQETIRAPLNDMDDYITRGKYKSFAFGLYNFKKDSVIELKDHQKSSKKGVIRIYLQKDSTIERGTFIDVLAGATKEGNLFVVIDKNYNKNFLDDSVYSVMMNRNYESRADFIKAWPIIKLDSLKIYDSMNSPHYFSTSLLFAVLPDPGYTHFKNTEDVLTYKKGFEIDIFTIHYLQASFNIANYAYEFCVDLHPLYFSFYKLLSEKERYYYHNVILRKKLPEKDTIVYISSLLTFRNKLIEGFTLDLGAKKIIIKNISLDSNYIDYYIKDSKPLSMEPKKYISISGYSLQDKKTITISSKSREFNLIFFSGSWCVPCHEAQPLFNTLFKKFNKKVNFITIAFEKNLSDATKYFHKVEPKYYFLYENSTTKKPDYFTQQFNITTFPSFLLIGNNGEIKYSGNSILALKKIKKILESKYN
jgi:thiol-disulfide isomerase/thioredoxin